MKISDQSYCYAKNKEPGEFLLQKEIDKKREKQEEEEKEKKKV